MVVSGQACVQAALCTVVIPPSNADSCLHNVRRVLLQSVQHLNAWTFNSKVGGGAVSPHHFELYVIDDLFHQCDINLTPDA